VGPVRFGTACYVDAALGAHIDAGGIDQKRHVVEILPRLENENRTFSWLHRQIKSRHGCDPTGSCAGGVHDSAGLDRLTICELDRGHAISCLSDSIDRFGYEIDAPGLQTLAEKGE